MLQNTLKPQAPNNTERRKSTTRTRTATAMDLELRPRHYRFVWLFIVGLHLACAVFLTQFARVYHLIAHPNVESIAVVVIGDLYPYLRRAGVGVGIVSALHWWQLLNILWSSLQARELVFATASSGRVSRALSTFTARVSSRSGSASASCVPRSTSVFQRFQQLGRFVVGLFGALGVESQLFRVVFTVREVAEVVSQTFQAKRSSELLARPWINHFLVTLIVVNCVSTPVLQHFLHRHEGAERVVCLLLDTMLNISSSMVIPIVVILPYYRALSPETLSSPPELQFDSVWFSKCVTEIRFLFSLATSDVLLKLVQHLGIYSSLTSVVALICRQEEASTAARIHPGGTQPAEKAVTTSKPPTPRDVRTASGIAKRVTSSQALARASRRGMKAVHMCFFMWALAVLAVHIRATVKYQHAAQGCSLSLASWFAAGYPCSVHNYNCYRQGTTSPDEESWSHLEPDTLIMFAVTHCTGLKMPRRIQNYQNLFAILLHNNTLVEWSRESAVAAMKHLSLSVLVLTRFNYSTFPDGLLEPLPATLQVIQLTYSNLTTLPSDLHTKWHSLSTFYFEHCQVRELPITLLSLPIRELSLHGNRIERLPELVDFHHPFYSLVLSENPLVALPDTLGDGTSFEFFSAERTPLTSLPSWLRPSVKGAMYLFGTSFCESQTTKETACVVRDNRVDGKSPIATFDMSFPV